MQKLRDAFVGKYGGVLHLFGTDFFGDLNDVNAGFLANVFRKHLGRRHPLKHVFLIDFLFDSLEELLEVCRKVQAADLNGGEAAINRMLCEDQLELVKLVTSGGLPVSHAAAKIGVSGGTAVKFLKKRGVNDRRLQPHIIGTPKEKKLSELLQLGLARQDVAAAAGVSKNYIVRYLAKRPQLKKTWADAQYQLGLQLHRERLSTFLKLHSYPSLKSIRRSPGSGYQWLYDNDRVWLQEALPAIWKR
jgi:hypothetical protein